MSSTLQTVNVSLIAVYCLENNSQLWEAAVYRQFISFDPDASTANI